MSLFLSHIFASVLVKCLPGPSHSLSERIHSLFFGRELGKNSISKTAKEKGVHIIIGYTERTAELWQEIERRERLEERIWVLKEGMAKTTNTPQEQQHNPESEFLFSTINQSREHERGRWRSRSRALALIPTPMHTQIILIKQTKYVHWQMRCSQLCGQCDMHRLHACRIYSNNTDWLKLATTILLCSPFTPIFSP